MFLYILTTTEYKYNLCQSGTGIFSGLQLLNEWSENVFKGRCFPRILLKANSEGVQQVLRPVTMATKTPFISGKEALQ